MIRKFIITFFCSALFLFTPSALTAGVDGSPHDLVSQGYVPAGERGPRSKCLFCHFPVSLTGDELPAGPPASVNYFSESGLLCYSCHDGTTIVNPEVDAIRGSFHPASHPLERKGTELPELIKDSEIPHIDEKRLECLSCHNPHDNARRPFLRKDMVEICLICHLNFENDGYGGENMTANHPVHETIIDDAGQSSPLDIQPEFQVPFPRSYPLRGGRLLEGIHWQRGGHILGEKDEKIECFTCHAVHGGESDPPMADLLVIDPVREAADLFCEGCHRGFRADGLKTDYFPNPGGTVTARTYHPCDDDEGNGRGQIVKILRPKDWPMGEGATLQILCSTCHVPHGGMSGSPLLRRPVSSATFCEECHRSEFMPFHHPSGTGSNPDGICETQEEEFSIGDSVSGETYCISCHVVHNAGLGKNEEEYIPILRFSIYSDELCLDCHSEENYTCLEGQEGTASHFLGDPTLPETYEDPEPPIKETPWPETGLYSRYGGENSKEIICLSCHSFSSDGDDEVKEPLDNYLVARSGSTVEWVENPAVYLCTGCHGEDPATMGTGHTHPLMDAEISALSIEPSLPATYTTGGRINCDSCHTPHGAPPGGGYYILKEGNSANTDPESIHPQVNFTGLCQLCHSADKY